MRPHTAPPGEAWGLGSGPFVLSGRPPHVSGEIELVNRSPERVKVRAIPARSSGKRGSAPAVSGNLRLSARLEPGRTERVFAHLEIAPETPPGTYEADAEVGTERARMVVHVFEKHAVVLRPGRVELRGAPGDSLAHVLVVANRGNVVYAVPRVVLVHLEERDWFGRSLVYALRETEQDDGHQAYLDRLLRELKATDVPPMRVELSAAAAEVAPGTTAEVGLTLTVPEGLAKGRTYLRTIPFMGAQLTFQIECNGSVQSSKRRPR